MRTGPIDRVVDEHVAELIAAIDALRDDLEAIAAQRMTASGAAQLLTVDQVARQLGVSRSTVYAHWREWGGYKLGAGDKAPIRFASATLPIAKQGPAPSVGNALARPGPSRADRKRQRRHLVRSSPRLAQPFPPIA
jgi:hypothetical protein